MTSSALSAAVILSRFFDVDDLSRELNELSDAEMTELATLAAAEMGGVTLKEAMYREIVFIQGDDFGEFETVLDRDEHAAFEYLLQWESGGGRVDETSPWGKEDYLYEHERYVMSYNPRLGYAGLCVRVGPRLVTKSNQKQ